ncbi:MAG: hypothetical protein WBA74_13300 [Cyclobacteriaceae bacterium]
MPDSINSEIINNVKYSIELPHLKDLKRMAETLEVDIRELLVRTR